MAAAKVTLEMAWPIARGKDSKVLRRLLQLLSINFIRVSSIRAAAILQLQLNPLQHLLFKGLKYLLQRSSLCQVWWLREINSRPHNSLWNIEELMLIQCKILSPSYRCYRNPRVFIQYRHLQLSIIRKFRSIPFKNWHNNSNKIHKFWMLNPNIIYSKCQHVISPKSGARLSTLWLSEFRFSLN